MKQFLLICLSLFSFSAFAQDASPKDPTHWKYYMIKISDNTYEFHASVQIDNNWHIFTQNPGGDGFMIPTEISFNNDNKLIGSSEVKFEGKVVSTNFEGVGMVNYFVNEARIVATIKTTKDINELKGTITYQSCNDKMCLPPVDLNFVTTLK